MNKAKPVATAIATFISIDKFVIFPFNYGHLCRPFFLILRILYRFEFRHAYGRQWKEEKV